MPTHNLFVYNATCPLATMRIRAPECTQFKIFHKPCDYDQWIRDYSEFFSHNGWSSLHTQKQCFPGIRTYADILSEDDAINNRQLNDLRPNRILIVQYRMRHTHTMSTVCDGSIKLDEALVTELNRIVTLQEAMQFIDKFGLCYPEASYALGPFHTLEILLSSFNYSQEQLNEMGVSALRILNLDSNGDVNVMGSIMYEPCYWKDTVVKLFTLKSRINRGLQNTWSERDILDFHLRIFQRNVTQWEMIGDILETNFPKQVNADSLAILREASKLRLFNYELKRDYFAKFVASHNEYEGVDVDKLWDEIFFEKTVAHFSEKKAKPTHALRMNMEDLMAKTFDFFRGLVVENINFYGQLNMLYLNSSQTITEFLESNRGKQNVLILHDQDLICRAEADEFKEMCNILENRKLLDLDVNYVLVDYDLHANDTMLGTDKKLHEMSYFKSRIHLVAEWSELNQPNRAVLDLSASKLAGMLDLNSYNKEKRVFFRLDLSKNYMVKVINRIFFPMINFESKLNLPINYWIVLIQFKKDVIKMCTKINKFSPKKFPK